MEMIERYIYAVTQKLPQEGRKDIAEELRGLIQDMLDERAETENTKNYYIEEILLELGSPRELADKYRGTKKYLIGPELFDTYALIVKTILIVISALIGIGFLIATVLNPIAILDHFIEMIVSLITALPMAFGWTTFGFAIGEFFGGAKQKDLLGKEWAPSELPPVPSEKKQISRSESILSIIFYAILIVFLVFSNEYFGVWVVHDEFTGVVPFLNAETYPSYLVLVSLILGFGILKECFKLVKRNWTSKLATLTVVVNTISIGMVIAIINQSDFWNPHFLNQLVEAGIVTAASEAFQVITIIWEQFTFWIFILLIIGLVWEAVAGVTKARKK
jgi:uncharacterized membrane protein